MNDFLMRVIPVFAGFGIGIFFYGGLWWTVKKGITSSYAGLWFSLSLLIRTAVAVSGFYFVMQSDWRRLIVCLFGFLAARLAITLLTKEPESAT